MRVVFSVALDLLREAFARKWILGLLVAITLLLLLLGSFLRLDVVDGAISGSRLFGTLFFRDVVSAEAGLRVVYQMVAVTSFFLGALFLCVACSDFAPELLSPGRIEHLLSLPIARWQLLLGTWLGVVSLSALCSVYGSAGLTLLFGIKTAVWTTSLIQGSLLGVVGFSALYAAMLATAFFVRSAAASAGVGLVVLVLGILASFREKVEEAIEAGIGRIAFHYLIQPFPRFWTLADQCAGLAGNKAFDVSLTARLVVGALIFAAALLAVAAYRFERKDF